MSILKLKPTCKDYIWGGHRLAEEYGIEYDGDVLAEAWELSCHPDGPSMILNGPYAGKSLAEYIETEGRDVLGAHCRRFRDFPILTKFIDAKQNLSIQVHPDNRYALKNEGQYGKTEMWYVVDAGAGAFLYYGFKKEITREEFAERIENDTLLEVLNAVPVQKGDVLFIESGTIHAIGQNILIAEIQQNSNVTYRVYDYGRVGRDGKKRDLHIEKALAVTNRVPIVKSARSYPHVADCDYFTVDKLNLDGRMMSKMEGVVSGESFVSILMLDGSGTITCGEEKVSYQKGDSLFLSAGSGAYEIEGSCDALITSIREKAGSVRLGIEVTSSDVRVGLVDVHQHMLASEVFPMEREKKPEEVIKQIGRTALALLGERDISMDQCSGAGVGIPGTIDRKTGTVVYSNNIRWEQVPVAKLLAAYLPVPIKVANNADCAVLGEASVGAARDCQDVVMLTIGSGVGAGILLNGRLFEGGRLGGSELGHMVIEQSGRPCTCGRQGCLETYASLTALKRDVGERCGRTLGTWEIFRQYENGDQAVSEVVEEYMDRLGTGVVNIVNIFRPQVLLLGGAIARQGEYLLNPLRETVRKNCFGQKYGEVPEIELAALGEETGMIGAASLL